MWLVIWSVTHPGNSTLNSVAVLSAPQDEYRDAPGSVITADFYNASALLPLSDEAIVARVKAHLETCEPSAFKGRWRF